MNKKQIIIGIFGIAFSISSSLGVAAKLYKWVDENGKVHYSDKIPPKASKQEHRELNSQGITTKSVNKAVTLEERQKAAAEKAAHAEQLRQEQAANAKQRQRDRILLDTFITERDLILTRDDRLGAIQSSLNLMDSNNQRLKKQIKETADQIKIWQESEIEVPENFKKKLSNLNGQLGKNQAFIKIKKAEYEKVTKQFELDLERFRELKTGKSDSKLAANESENNGSSTEAEPANETAPVPGDGD